ncbi:MAG TPA: hypothetical protein VHS05_15860 [Pyrinomonadaceae bacterium]|nr:hypothetical protein [Pyrinomonadaceae bacterium]
MAVVLPVTITIVFALADLTFPFEETISLCPITFAGFLLSYRWV